MISLKDIFRKVIAFLNREGYEYMVIGGVASGVIGYPRLTEDIDISISIRKSEVMSFIKNAEKEGYIVEKKMLKRAQTTGTFQIKHGDSHIDFIITSTDFEAEALKRKKMLEIYGVIAPFPTAEDLILLKMVPARHIDLADIENIALRHKGRLDEKYLLDWAMKLSDEAEDMRIYNEVEKLLKL